MNIWQKKKVVLLAIKFLPLHRLYKCPDYNYSKIKLNNSFMKQNFVKIITTHLDHNLKDAGYFIGVSIKSFTVFLETFYSLSFFQKLLKLNQKN